MDTESDAVPLSVVVPVYGCTGCLEELVDRLHAAVSQRWPGYEVILVDDAGPNRAWPRIVELATTRHAVRGLRMARNFGQHPAISAGLAHARAGVVVVMDCDLQDLPEEIEKLVDSIDDQHRVALAARSQRRDGPYKRFGSWTFYRLLGWLTGMTYDHRTANFGAYSREVVDAVLAMPESNRFFPLLVQWCGFPVKTVPVQHGARVEGQSGYSLRRLLSLALEIALSYSDKPLRLMIWLGLAFALVSLGLAAYSILEYMTGSIQVAGFTSIIASMWLIGGVSVSAMGMIGLYVGRIFLETKRRPWYVVQDRIGFGRN